MRTAHVAGLATEGPRELVGDRERSAWWCGVVYGLMAGFAVGAAASAYLLARIVERAGGVAP